MSLEGIGHLRYLGTENRIRPNEFDINGFTTELLEPIVLSTGVDSYPLNIIVDRDFYNMTYVVALKCMKCHDVISTGESKKSRTSYVGMEDDTINIMRAHVVSHRCIQELISKARTPENIINGPRKIRV